MTEPIPTDRKPDLDDATVLFFSYSLACKYVSEKCGQTPDFWLFQFGKMALEILSDDDFTSLHMEQFMATNFPNFESED